jgi:tetratricopeptide (TPR) repeat protein
MLYLAGQLVSTPRLLVSLINNSWTASMQTRAGKVSVGFVVLVMVLAVKAAVRGYYIGQSMSDENRPACSERQTPLDPESLKVPEEVLRRRQEQKARHERVLASLEAGDHAAARAALDEAIEVEPKNAEWYLVRGKVSEDFGDHAGAIADYDASTRLSPDAPLAHQKLAWVLATSPDSELRDGAKAIEHALRFLELKGDRDWKGLDTVAAALAEAGSFEKAVVAQRRALRFAPDNDRPALEQRLQCYEAHRPFRTGG